MTNHEKYKQAFSCIKPRDGFLTEVTQMENKKKHFHLNKIAAVAAAFVLVLGSAQAAYAHNVGNIQRILQLWIHGDQTQVTVEFDGTGSYDMAYTDAEGDVHQQSGGGVAFDADGTERPLTEEELLEELMSPDMYTTEEGRTIITWGNQVVDITDDFVDGVCYVKLVNGDETRYITAHEGQGFSMSPYKFLEPTTFN